MNEPNKAVFLSYASQDAEAARQICEALRAAGVEVWFDQSELRGGDAWDAKIRKQIKECALFVPVISANTQARAEGYFRREWKLAVDRTHDMADHVSFLLPIVIDDTQDAAAFVPEKFREVQWTRLQAGETASAFCARVKALLEGEREAQPPPAASLLVRPGALVAPGKRWQKPAIAAALLVGLALATWGLGGFNPRPKTQNPEPTAAVPPSEARKLVEKARAVFDAGDLVNRETYVLTEALLKKAEELDVTDAEAWALHATVSRWMDWFGLDTSVERKEAVRVQAERAFKLAPTAVSSRLAYATMLMGVGGNTDEAEHILKSLLVERPRDWRVLHAVGALHRRKGQMDESVAMLQRARRLSDDHQEVTGDLLTVLVVAGRYAEAEAVVAEALLRNRNGRVLEFDVRLKLNWRGDAAAAAAALERWPAWMLNEDRGVQCAAQVWMWNRQPAKALAALERFPRDYIRHARFTGPRAAVTAWLHEQAGNAQAAQADWKLAFRVAERELSVAPTSSDALHWKAWALARLGDRAAAEAIGEELRERKGNTIPWNESTVGLVALGLVLNQPDRAFAELQNIFSENGGRGSLGFVATRAVLDLNPCFDAVRADPRFQAIRATAPAPEKIKGPAASVATLPSKSLAVLAFRQLSADPENEYLCEAISDELCNVLGRVPGLKVAASASAFSFKGKRVRPSEMAAQLGVAYLVDGTVQKIGSRVRVRAELIKASDETPVWRSEPLDHEVKDMFAVQDAVVGAIAKNPQLQLGGAASRPSAINPEAYRLYIEGRQAWSERREAGFARAEELFNRALLLEPSFTRAMVGLADVAGLRGKPDRAKALTLIRTALSLNPELAEAHASLGVGYLQDLETAERAADSLRRAIELNPNYASAHQWLAIYYKFRGRIDEAMAENRMAASLDPLSDVILGNLANSLREDGRPTEALALAAKFPANPRMANVTALCLLDLGRNPEALEALNPAVASEQMLERNNASRVVVLARSGRHEEALALFERARTDEPGTDRMFNIGILRMMAVLQRRDEFFQLLESISPTVTTAARILNDLEIAPMRDDPRFQTWLERSGLVDAHRRVVAWRAANPAENRR